mgnify:CR=1 FL=1
MVILSAVNSQYWATFGAASVLYYQQLVCQENQLGSFLYLFHAFLRLDKAREPLRARHVGFSEADLLYCLII